MSAEKVILCAQDSSELRTRIEALEISVPSRTERQKWQREQWQMHDFLKYLESVHCLQVPVTLRKRERPDFRLNFRGGENQVCQLLFGSQCYGQLEIGVECSEVIDESEAERMTWEEKQGETEYVLLCEDGYVGDSIEEEFAECISSSLQKKHERLIKGYERFSTSLLLLYYNNFRPSIRFDSAVSRAAEKLRRYWNKSTSGFEVIIVRVDRELMIFKSGYFGLLPRPDEQC